MANIIQCPIHGWFAAGFGVCPECASKPVTLQTSEPQAVTVVRGKKSRKRETGKPVVQPAPLKVMPTKQYTKSIDPILATLKAEGMDTDSAIVEGLRTGRVVQAISWQVNYLHVIDYLESKGYDVGRYRFRVVCGSDAA